MEEGTRRVRRVPFAMVFGVCCSERLKAFAEGRDVFLHFLISMINAKRCAKMIPYLLELPFCIRSAFAFICASGTT